MERLLVTRTRMVIIVAVTVIVGATLLVGLQVGKRLVESSNPCGRLTDLPNDIVQGIGGHDGAVLGIAHNAGAGPNELKRAIDCGATAVEIDVVAVQGQLRAAHEMPPAAETGEAPLLEDLWPIAAGASLISIDLKSTTPETLELLGAFLAHAAPSSPTIVVTSKDAAALGQMRERAPEALRFLSLETREQLAALRDDPTLQEALHGVTMKETLVDDTTIPWLRERQLTIWAWTVDNPVRALELLDLEVEGIITDSLPLLDALQSDEAQGTAEALS